MSLLRGSILFSIFTIFAQFLGIVRDIVLARFVGVGETLDIYYMAFKIPDFLGSFYTIFLGSVIFIPIITRAYRDKNQNEVSQKVNETFTLVSILVVFSTLLAAVFMPQLTKLLVPEWSVPSQETLTHLSRILLLAQVIFPLGVIAGSVAMVYGKAKNVAIAGAMYNLGGLVGAVALFPFFGIYGVAGGVVLGSLLYAGIQIYPQDVRYIFKKLNFVYALPAWIDFLRTNMPRVFSVIVWQMFVVLLSVFAARYGESGVSVFNIAYKIEVSLIAILGMSVAAVSMPLFSKHHESQDLVSMKNDMTQSVALTLYVSLLVSAFLYTFSYYLISLLYMFSKVPKETMFTISSIFAVFVLSLPLQNYFEVIRKYFYAVGKVKEVSVMVILFVATTIAAYVAGDRFVNFQYPVMSIAWGFFFGNLVTLAFVTVYYRLYVVIDFKKVFSLYFINTVYKRLLR